MGWTSNSGWKCWCWGVPSSGKIKVSCYLICNKCGNKLELSCRAFVQFDYLISLILLINLIVWPFDVLVNLMFWSIDPLIHLIFHSIWSVQFTLLFNDQSDYLINLIIWKFLPLKKNPHSFRITNAQKKGPNCEISFFLTKIDVQPG